MSDSASEVLGGRSGELGSLGGAGGDSNTVGGGGELATRKTVFKRLRQILSVYSSVIV